MSDPDQLAREALRLLGPAPENWVPPRDSFDHNVLIVGGGQGGSAFAYALRRAGIGGVSVIDAAPDATQAGVWLTRARMHKLRTVKNLVGPELGVTALGFQAWYEARHGSEAYAALDRIPRTDWAAYLDWFRRFLDIEVRYGTQLTEIAPHEGAAVPGLAVQLVVNGQARTETTRKLALARSLHAAHRRVRRRTGGIALSRRWPAVQREGPGHRPVAGCDPRLQPGRLCHRRRTPGRPAEHAARHPGRGAAHRRGPVPGRPRPA
ncbi:hypothetical protein CTP10_R53050 [Cupriavidus sp. P-10]|uniref:FAD/NAD(P)-binding protein n=1 Tax=Cupriavidus sp. P-10 TaxID=2027911 RepID=UPI000EE7761B|nr:FAD/NAD(P)-binding protein [Cupriavidus sp. P-10]BDB27894.1 hypothetical protein CTP10_R53050 [Cupriavidus sp. P-10]